MKLSLLPVLLVTVAASGFAACGGSTSNGNAAPTNDAGTTVDEGGTDPGGPDASDETPPPADHGAPSTTYPAFKADMPQLNKNAGQVLSAPVIVTVAWANDPNITKLEAFADQIGTSDYWKAIGSEYGVGKATVGGHVRIPVDATHPLPTTISTDELDSLVEQGAGSASSGWPAPTAQTIYLVYLHPEIAVTANGGDACQQFGGYHSVTQQSNFIYAIALPCTKSASAGDVLTVTASHELGEAATDPGPGTGYYGFDSGHVAWTFFQRFQVENGDACEFYSTAEYMGAAPFAFKLQRLWSNAAAAAGHNPCVPAAPGPYFGVVPTAPEMVSYTGRSGASMTKGFNIAVGATKTFPVGFFSDGPTTGPWSIRAAEGFTPGVGGPTASHLSVSVDKTSGQNGEIAYVTVTVNKAGTTIGTRPVAKANYVTILSSLGNSTFFTPILITNN